LVSSIKDIVHHNYGFDFEIFMPNEYEFCGHVLSYFCSVGEPIKYHSIDFTLTK